MKMKKTSNFTNRFLAVLALSALLLCSASVLTGCGENGGENKTGGTETADAAETAETAAAKKAGAEEKEKEKEKYPADSLDVDLTKLSSTMVYSEVYNMMMTPENYVGKTVRAHGQFGMYVPQDENGQPIPGIVYYACVVSDATACCAQGLEFTLEDGKKYPADYPKVGEEFTVTGVLETYVEDGFVYPRLRDAVIG